MLKISNSLDQYSSHKTEIQLREKLKIDFSKMEVKNACRRSQNLEKYTQKCANRTREYPMRRIRAHDHGAQTHDQVPRTRDHMPRDV